MRDFLLFLHIAGAAGWIGGGLFAMFGVGRLAKAGGSSNGRAIAIIVEKAGSLFDQSDLGSVFEPDPDRLGSCEDEVS